MWGMPGCFWVCTGVRRCAAGVCGCVHRSERVCLGVHGCVHGCVRVYGGVPGYTWVYLGVRWCPGVCGYAWVYACVWDEFSEFLLETRVLTSADFNIYPIRILLSLLDNAPMWVHYLKENVQCIVYTIYYLVLQMKMMDQNATNLSWCLVMEEQKILQKY